MAERDKNKANLQKAWEVQSWSKTAHEQAITNRKATWEPRKAILQARHDAGEGADAEEQSTWGKHGDTAANNDTNVEAKTNKCRQVAGA